MLPDERLDGRFHSLMVVSWAADTRKLHVMVGRATDDTLAVWRIARATHVAESSVTNHTWTVLSWTLNMYSLLHSSCKFGYQILDLKIK